MKLVWKNSIVALLLLLSNVVRGQETFHNIYFFDDSVAVISDILPTDSGYYFVGTEISKTNFRAEALFGKLNLDGSMNFFVRNVDLNSNQFVYSCRTQLQTDSQGHFTFSARNEGGGSVPRLLKYDAQGIKVVDTVYRDLWSTDSLEFYSKGRIFTPNQKDCHYLFFTYYDELNDDETASGNPGESGVLLAKLNEPGEILWQKRLANPSSANYKPSYFVGALDQLTDTSLFLTIGEYKQFPSNQVDQEWAKVHFFVLDTAGNEQEHYTFQDGQLNFQRQSFLKTESVIIYPNLVSEYSNIPPSTQLKWRYTSVLTCLDENYDLKWKDTLIDNFVLGNNYQSPQKLIQTSDSTFAGAFTYEYQKLINSTTFEYILFPIQLFNKSLETGEDVWVRNYRYFPEDSSRRYTHEIIDLERTYDGGYIMCGSVSSLDSLQADRPAEYGYVIKTNCLGFLGDPEVATSYSFGENNTVIFNNESIQAGSFYWDFGDGTFLTTGEDTNAVIHEYGATGVYTVQLIGYGCDGKNDTLSFEIDFEYTEPGYAGDGTLLTLYPNPVSTGNSLAFYVGNLPVGNHHLNVFNSLGQRVDQFLITDSNTNYLYAIDYAAGMYHFTLQNDTEILEVEKLIVE